MAVVTICAGGTVKYYCRMLHGNAMTTSVTRIVYKQQMSYFLFITEIMKDVNVV